MAFFDSINEAIDGALEDKIVTERETDEMKTVLRKVMEQNVFRGAFGVVARGDLSIAVQASEVLAKTFKRKDLAAVINVTASDNRVGSVLRLAIRSAKAGRQRWFTKNRTTRYPAYSEMVKNRMLQLGG